jgi:hypothetical protein
METFFIHGASRSGHEVSPLQAAHMECAEFHFVGAIDKSNNPHRTAMAVGDLKSEPGRMPLHSSTRPPSA